jgi:hypothetical protein
MNQKKNKKKNQKKNDISLVSLHGDIFVLVLVSVFEMIDLVLLLLLVFHALCFALVEWTKNLTQIHFARAFCV